LPRLDGDVAAGRLREAQALGRRKVGVPPGLG
jgi:hypothetical protein